jgi:membrane protease YdiL (CAAX protease family)
MVGTMDVDELLCTDASVQPSSPRLAISWLAAAAVAAVVVPFALGASLPLLTFVWLVTAAIVLRRTGTSSAIGLARLPGDEFARVTVPATVAMTLLFGVAEFVGHPYRELLELIREESSPDSTFAWVVDEGRGWGLLGFALYGALVTIFAEEIVFRGALMSGLRRRGPMVAVGVTAVAFALVQALPAALLSPGAAVGFVAIDALIAVGVVGGLAAYRTRSVYPSIVAITVANVVVLAAVA